MQKFIGVKLVDAKPMTRGEFYPLRGWYIAGEESPEDPGYMVKYPDGYTSWCPKAEFEKRNISLAADNNTISQKDVDAMIKHIHVSEIEPNTLGTKIIIVTATLSNGFTITESSTCVDPQNYDPETGLTCCMERIKNKVRLLLGFLLSCGVNGFQKVGV